MQAPRAIIVGTLQTCLRLEAQLDLLPQRPRTVGWVLNEPAEPACDRPVLGTVHRLEAIVRRERPDLALVCLPAAMIDLITLARTRLRRLDVPERYVPPLEDLLAGVGPRSVLEIDPQTLLGRSPRWIDRAAVGRVIGGARVLITGAGGSIGSELARIAAAAGPAHLTLVDRAENALFEIDRQIARRHPDLERRALLHDVVDAAGTLDHFLELQPRIVFHAAAHKHVPMMEDHPAAAVDNNFFGTRSVADAAHAAGAARMVMVSTDKAVNPTSIMGATKRLAELYVQHLNTTSPTIFSAVRFGNVLGSSGSVLQTWAKQIADGGPVTVTHPEMTRYFMSIPEAAALVVQVAALGDAAGGEVFVLDMGEPVHIVDLARRFVELHGLQPVVQGEPAPDDDGAAAARIVFTGPRPGEKMHEQLAGDREAMAPTPHPDICVWKLSTPHVRYVERVLRALDPGRRPADPVALARLIRRLVPECTAGVAA